MRVFVGTIILIVLRGIVRLVLRRLVLRRVVAFIPLARDRLILTLLTKWLLLLARFGRRLLVLVILLVVLRICRLVVRVVGVILLRLRLLARRVVVRLARRGLLLLLSRLVL